MRYFDEEQGQENNGIAMGLTEEKARPSYTTGPLTCFAVIRPERASHNDDHRTLPPWLKSASAGLIGSPLEHRNKIFNGQLHACEKRIALHGTGLRGRVSDPGATATRCGPPDAGAGWVTDADGRSDLLDARIFCQ